MLYFLATDGKTELFAPTGNNYAKYKVRPRCFVKNCFIDGCVRGMELATVEVNVAAIASGCSVSSALRDSPHTEERPNVSEKNIRFRFYTSR